MTTNRNYMEYPFFSKDAMRFWDREVVHTESANSGKKLIVREGDKYKVIYISFYRSVDGPYIPQHLLTTQDEDRHHWFPSLGAALGALSP